MNKVGNCLNKYDNSCLNYEVISDTLPTLNY